MATLGSNPLFHVKDTDLRTWLSEANLAKLRRRIFQGFELIDGLDGGIYPDREVSLATIKQTSQYPQHVHRNSDAIFYIISGEAELLSGTVRRRVQPGDRIEIPRGMPHGFEISDGTAFSFITVQSPPIRNRDTGEEDFTLIEAI